MRSSDLERSFTEKGFMAEGHSINRPPFFDGTGYSYWKNRMEVFIMAQDYEVWKVICHGPVELPTDESLWSRDQIRQSTINYSAMNIL